MEHKIDLVSVIVPVYNCEEYLKESIDSILNQTYRNIELIVVNDGSTDNSLKLLEQYGDEILLLSQSNKGQCAALNVGIKQAKGRYIKFFDGDDIMNSTHIEEQVKAINNSDSSIVMCHWCRFYDDMHNTIEMPCPLWNKIKPIEWIKSAINQPNEMMGGPLWLIPRETILKSGGWDEELSVNNDFEFVTRLLKYVDNIVFSERAMLYYRSGISTSLSLQCSESALKKLLLATKRGCQNLIMIEDSKHIREGCANRFKNIEYRIFPYHKHLLKEIRTLISYYGGSSISADGGKLFKSLKSLLGWKAAKIIQMIFYKLGYNPKTAD